MTTKRAPQLIAEAKRECEKVAVGPFTPIVFYHYTNCFSGKSQTLIGRPSGNHGGVVWA